MKQKVLAIYHKGCSDGTTAAAVFLKRFPRAKVFPLSHDPDRKDLAKIMAHIGKNTTVYTLDCVIGVHEFLKKAGGVVAIDHHAGVKKEMEELAKRNEKFMYVFSNNHSGASLAWKYFFPKKKPPQVVTLIEDLDLWHWRYGDKTRYAGGFFTPFTDMPERVKKYLSGRHPEIFTGGKCIADYDDYLIASFIRDFKPVYLRIGARKVPAFNCHIYESQLGNILSKKHKKAVAIYRIKGERVNVSFRSQSLQNPSAFALAKLCGGGGHRNSSAARIPLKKFLKMIII